MKARHKETLSVAEQATQWLLTMESPTTRERAAFWKWMDASPLHVREMILAVKAQRRLRGFDRDRKLDVEAVIAKARANITCIGEPHEPTTLRMVKPRRWPYAVAACVAMLAAASIAYLAVWYGRDTYSTKVGEQLVFELDDGSVVYLNTISRMKVRFSDRARDIYLPAGQALFQVKHDPARPFRVHTASSVVEAVGTQFDVRVLDDRTLVSVVEGVVQVKAPVLDGAVAESIHVPAPARLAAGDAATINEDGQIERTTKVDVAKVSAWRQQQLVFNEETLAWIVDEFNRYNAAPRLRVEGESLRSRRFNGVFNAHSPESLLEYLQQDSSITFDRRNDETIIREAVSPSFFTTDAQRR